MSRWLDIPKAWRTTAIVLCALAFACMLAACAGQAQDSAKPDSSTLSASDLPASSSSASTSQTSVSAESQTGPITYPAGWLAVDAGDIPAGKQLQILQLPDMSITAHRNGNPVADDEQANLQADWPPVSDGEALVEYEGRRATVPADLLLVNLPDVLPQVECDIVYSYSSTSSCAGQDIPGVTGERLPGYAEGMQDNPYWSAPRFNVPCAYRTALKAEAVCNALATQGYRLLIYDAYRPMTAQYYLSDAFENAFWSNAVMQESLGAWALEWYVASGSSGHNFGTDLDVGVCDMEGNPLPMPSAFDAFDESGHLTDWPIGAYSISPDSYRDAVSSNDACMALHEAFRQAGFTELASEWWHFADGETEGSMRAIVGSGGLDFTA